MNISRKCPKCGSLVEFTETEMTDVFTMRLFQHPLSQHSKSFLSEELLKKNYVELWDYDEYSVKSLKCPVCREQLIESYKPVFIYIIDIEEFSNLQCYFPGYSGGFEIVDCYFDEVDSGEYNEIKYILLDRNKAIPPDADSYPWKIGGQEYLIDPSHPDKIRNIYGQ